MLANFKCRALLLSGLGFVLCACSDLQHLEHRNARQEQVTGDIPGYGKEPSETEYRAVLMSNSMVLFGKLHGLGTPFPVLTDVYYVQTVEDSTTKKPTTVLVKRGKEWHAPDRTVLNASQIVLIEPVTSGSKVMDLIASQEGKK
jgi:hypothetical protein